MRTTLEDTPLNFKVMAQSPQLELKQPLIPTLGLTHTHADTDAHTPTTTKHHTPPTHNHKQHHTHTHAHANTQMCLRYECMPILSLYLCSSSLLKQDCVIYNVSWVQYL